MDSTVPQPSGDKSHRIPVIVLISLAALGIPSTAVLAFVTNHPLRSAALGLLYECFIGILGFLLSFWGKVWQRLEGSLVDRTTSWIETQASILFSRSWRRYREFLIHEHEVFDIKGLTTHPGRDLELEQVFVQPDVNPTPVHQVSVNPVPVPEALRDGSHHIWSYLTDKALRSRHFVIVGAPGSGKTTLLKHLALCLTKHGKAGVQRIPVFLYLRDHATTLKEKYDPSTDTFAYSLAEAVNIHIQRKWQQSFPLAWIKRKLTKCQCLVLLDGLDEVADDRLRKLIVKWVQSQMLACAGNRFLLTSRPYGYRDNPLEGVWVLETRPFTPGQVGQFVRNWYRANEYKSWGKKDIGMQMRAREGADDLLSRLYRVPALLAFAVNPLLLTMIATVHRYRGSLPGSRVALYSEICEVFLGKRRQAIGLVQELTPAQILQVLRPLAYAFMQQGMREMELKDACQIIAPYLLDVSTGIQPDEFLRMVQNSSGLLLERNPGLYGFAHKTFQEYLTAAYMKEERREQELVALVQDDWWHETIRLYCALADATAIVQSCLVNDPPTVQALALALDCVEEKHTIKPAVKEQLDTLLERGREDPDPERRRVIAEALLRRRLDQMVHLHDEVFVDTSFITCAEYQLFLDEQQAKGQEHQPDHWSTPTFPPGHGHFALLGMRPADVSAFCQWLIERDTGVWRYRMPTMSEHQDIEEKFQSTGKLESGRGYWVNKGQAFVWVGDEVPLFTLGTLFFPFGLHRAPANALDLDRTFALTNDFPRDRASALDLDRTFARALHSTAFNLDRVSDYTFNLARDIARAFDLDRTFDLDRAHASDLAYNLAYNLARNLADDLASDLNLADDLAYNLVRNLASDLNFARYHDRDHTFAHNLARVHELAHNLANVVAYMTMRKSHLINVHATIILVRALVYSRALTRVLSFLASPHPRRWWRWFSQRKVTNETDEELRWPISFALHLYIELLLIAERREGRLPAWEGILLVKESKQALSTDTR